MPLRLRLRQLEIRMPRITLIHATALAIEPTLASFRRLWPQAQLHSVLDDGLTDALITAPQTLVPRFQALAAYAVLARSSAVLFTCSAFGEAIDAARAAVALPMLKPNEAMFDDALQAGRRVALLATFEPTIDALSAEFAATCAAAGTAATLLPMHVKGAMEALAAGQPEAHDRLIEEAAARLPPHDAVMLGQFSMARAASRVAHHSTAPVFTSPDSAVLRLRQLVG